MCVGATARDAFNLGHRPTIVASATAALQAASLAAAADLFAVVGGKPDDIPDRHAPGH
ncbi:isochorismatase family protein [Streptomyces sp. 11x1]|uniref:isochorismatase family protein n=1 Tax=Streptomyces sp. 11x1 TaxID=3038642 RepID=UPI0037D9BC37